MKDVLQPFTKTGKGLHIFQVLFGHIPRKHLLKRHVKVLNGFDKFGIIDAVHGSNIEYIQNLCHKGFGILDGRLIVVRKILDNDLGLIVIAIIRNGFFFWRISRGGF